MAASGISEWICPVTGLKFREKPCQLVIKIRKIYAIIQWEEKNEMTKRDVGKPRRQWVKKVKRIECFKKEDMVNAISQC